nr:hypothetical protein 14 [Desulfobacterales bacterium]
MKKPMLPDAVSMGIIWDRFTGAIYKGMPFKEEFWQLIDEYCLADAAVAKLYGLIKAFKAIGFNANSDGLVACQHPFTFSDSNVTVNGYIDRAYKNHFVETKLSSRPDFYHVIHNITSQVATYFLSNEQYEYCVIEAVRVPQVKTGYGQYSGESSSSYMDRIYSDILSRPSHYFLGFNRDDKTFGKRFWRTEFPLEQIREDYQKINRDIQRAIEEDSFYQNFLACHVPAACQFLPICETGVVSDSIYERKPLTRGGAKS